MNTLFHETFETVSNGLPGGWYVENNSNLKAVPAIRKGENCLELLSAGNKFTVKCTIAFNFTMTKNDFEGGFAYLTSFRYNTVSGHGQTLRMRRNQKNETVVFEYGTMRQNIFTPCSAQEIPVTDAEMDKPIDMVLVIKGKSLTVESFNQSVHFEIAEGKGKIAISP